LEKTLADLKAEGKPANSIIKNIIAHLCTEEVRAILLKNSHKICLYSGLIGFYSHL